ncbi:MAG TPA: GNAT family N-acetyltransferase, partial [Spirochaetota bacterium]|nr:GNAT family N-acetyltransferase [Spirochaetota bacterium]
MINLDKYQIRDYVKESDAEVIEKITRETNYFTKEETLIARELVEERLQKGIKSSYLFNILEKESEIAAYSCFGEVPCSYISYDLYWIVVRNDLRGNGIGAYLLKKSEEYIKKLGGYQI